MKQLMLIICVSVSILAAISCKKEHHEPAGGSIVGLWELSRISGQIIIAYPPGTGNTLELTNDHYTIYKNGILDKEGTYVLTPDGSASEVVMLQIPADQFKDRIVYDGKTDSTKEFVQVSGNKLSIITGNYAFDAGNLREYVKK